MTSNNGSLRGYEHAVEMELDDPFSFMEKPVDYLIPAATEKSIHKVNAPKLMCKAIFEGANGPTTFAGEEILIQRGIVVSPDLLTNGGGVTCSYFEWLKNIDHVSPGKMTKKFEEQSTRNLLNMLGIELSKIDIKGAEEIDIVYSALDEIMTTAVKDNWEYSVSRDLNFRDACLVRQMRKLVVHYKECGLTV